MMYPSWLTERIYRPSWAPGVFVTERGPVKEAATTVWVALYSHYIHGIFESHKDAEDYTRRRWGTHPPTTWKIEPHVLGSGAFDPKDDE